MQQLLLTDWEGPESGSWVYRLRPGRDGKPDRTVPDTARSWGHVRESMKSCGGWLRFRHVLSGEHAGESRLHKAYFCMRRGLCVFCDHRRSVRTIRKFHPRVASMLRERPNLRVLFVTLTQRNGPDLAERFSSIGRYLTRWFQRRSNALGGGRHRTELTKAVAGVGSFEVKRGKFSGEWHPHYHGIWLTDGKLDWSACKDEWKGVTNGEGSFLAKHLRSQCAFDMGQIGRDEFETGIGHDLCEVFKYPVKPDRFLSRTDRFRAYLDLYGRVLIRAFGGLRDVEVPEDLTDDPLDWESLTYEEILYYFTGSRYVPAAREGILHRGKNDEGTSGREAVASETDHA